MSPDPRPAEPTRAELDARRGVTVVELGTSWCSWCRAAQPQIAAALIAQPQVGHLKIEDGPGRALGRSFAVKLWPTLIVLRDGRERARVVRPADAAAITAAISAATVAPEPPG